MIFEGFSIEMMVCTKYFPFLYSFNHLGEHNTTLDPAEGFHMSMMYTLVEQIYIIIKVRLLYLDCNYSVVP
jgi:hypothetical protein